MQNLNMENVKFQDDFNNMIKPKLPTMLNVLTILTFIGCALQLLFAVFGFLSAKKGYEEMDKTLASLNNPDVPEFARKMVGDPEVFRATMTNSFQNRVPILLLSIVAIALCAFGAVQMRKLKKQGYSIYLVGELLPFLTMAFFIGSGAMSGFGFYISVAIALLFIILYATQVKKFPNS